MLERVVESWLTRVNERSLEVPFCQLLTGEGYQVVHLSRHGPFEEGKDIIAISPEGTPCAFQLKGGNGGKITQRSWEGYIPQVIRLVELPIRHPSIDPDQPRRVFFVTTGELEEEVRTEIANRNIEWENRGLPRLETIVKGQLLTRFLRMQSIVWPVELTREKDLLDFFLDDGTGYLDKGKMSDFILDLLPLFPNYPNKSECARSLASAAIFTSYVLSPFLEKENHVAVIEGWTVYLASLIALATKHDLEEKYWRESFYLSAYAVEGALLDLCNELRGRKHLVEGNALVDALFYHGRATWLVAFVSAYVLWKRLLNPLWDIDDWYKKFVSSFQKDLRLWGEAAVPQFLSTYWFLRQTTASASLDGMLATIIEGICTSNINGEGLADPYHGLAEVVSQAFGLSELIHRESFKGRSYSLESLVHLFARRMWRQSLAQLWPNITELHYAEFVPAELWQFCLWASEEGVLQTSEPKKPQSWGELKREADEVNTSRIPDIFQDHPEVLLIFVITYPHRLTKDVAKYLDNRIREVKRVPKDKA
jgi:hypothetical protein